MITKTTKTTLLTGLAFAIMLPLLSMSAVDAQIEANDQERVEMKKQKIEKNFQQFLQVREATDALERELYNVKENLNDKYISSEQKESLIEQRDELKAQIDAAYEEIDRLEKISNQLREIPLEKETLLENTMQQIMDKYQIHADDNPNGLLEDVFISTKNEAIYVLKSTEEEVTQDSALQKATDNMKSELERLAADENIRIVISRVIEQSSCNLHSERDDYCQPAAGGVQVVNPHPTDPNAEPVTSTLGFPATRNSVSGFVTVGHATYTMNGGEDLYQPTESGSYKIGDLVVGFNDEDCDCAFFDLSPGRTVDAEVVSEDTFNWDIDEYIGTSGQTVGNYVYMSGITSGVEIGQIDSKPSGTNRIYADYEGDYGDSGAPVGKVLSGEFDVYGIHEGFVEGQESLSKYVPYDVIDDALNLD